MLPLLLGDGRHAKIKAKEGKRNIQHQQLPQVAVTLKATKEARRRCEDTLGRTSRRECYFICVTFLSAVGRRRATHSHCTWIRVGIRQWKSGGTSVVSLFPVFVLFRRNLSRVPLRNSFSVEKNTKKLEI